MNVKSPVLTNTVPALMADAYMPASREPIIAMADAHSWILIPTTAAIAATFAAAQLRTAAMGTARHAFPDRRCAAVLASAFSMTTTIAVPAAMRAAEQPRTVPREYAPIAPRERFATVDVSLSGVIPATVEPAAMFVLRGRLARSARARGFALIAEKRGVARAVLQIEDHNPFSCSIPGKNRVLVQRKMEVLRVGVSE
jgi:hypothetical protein